MMENRVEVLLNRILVQMSKIEDKLDYALYEDGVVIPPQKQQQQSPRHSATEIASGGVPLEDVIKYGEQVGYRRYDGDNADQLRQP